MKGTDNGVAAQLGKETATSVDHDKRLDFADLQLGNVASQVVINQGSGGGGDDVDLS